MDLRRCGSTVELATGEQRKLRDRLYLKSFPPAYRLTKEVAGFHFPLPLNLNERYSGMVSCFTKINRRTGLKRLEIFM